MTLPRRLHYEFFKPTGELVRVFRQGASGEPGLTSLGRAWTYFNCDATSAQEIRDVLPDARHTSEAPSALEIAVIDGLEQLPRDTPAKIMEIALKEAQPAGIRYAMEATLVGATNLETARHLHGVLNMMYMEPSIAQANQPRYGVTLWIDEATGDVLSQE